MQRLPHRLHRAVGFGRAGASGASSASAPTRRTRCATQALLASSSARCSTASGATGATRSRSCATAARSRSGAGRRATAESSCSAAPDASRRTAGRARRPGGPGGTSLRTTARHSRTSKQQPRQAEERDLHANLEDIAQLAAGPFDSSRSHGRAASAGPSRDGRRGYHGKVPHSSPLLHVVGALLLALGACTGEPPPPSPQAWTGFFHPPGKPGGSITNTKQCDCQACDPSSCCSAEQTELSGPPPAECSNTGDSYVFSEKCGITVQTCTPRCYSHVWRVGKQESCGTSRPLVCCN